MSKQFPYPFPERFRSRLMLHYRTRISGTEVQKKLPFRVLVLGNFTGLDAHMEPQDSQGMPKDSKAVLTVPALPARPVRSFRFGKSGERVDDFMAELLPYTKLPKELVTVLPGILENPSLTGNLPASAKNGEKVRMKLSGSAKFRSYQKDNGLCDVSGQVTIATEVDVDPATLPLTTEVALRGGGKARGLLEIPLKEEPVGVVAGIVRLDKATLTIQRSELEDGVLVATLVPPAASPDERRDRIGSDADGIAKQANELKTDSDRQADKANKLAAPAIPAAVTDPIKSILQGAIDDINAFLTDTKAATASYQAAAGNAVTASGKVDTRAGAVADAADFNDAAAKAEGGVRQARSVLNSADAAGSSARRAVDEARTVVEQVNAAIKNAETQAAAMASADASGKIGILADISRRVAAATSSIPATKTDIAKAKDESAAAATKAKAATDAFDAEADKPGAASAADMPAVAERVLPFDSISSFSPDEVISNVPELERLRVIRSLLLALQSEVRNSPDLRETIRTVFKDRTADIKALSADLAADYKQLAITPPKST